MTKTHYTIFGAYENKPIKIVAQERETKTLIILNDGSRWYKDTMKPEGSKSHAQWNIGPKQSIALATKEHATYIKTRNLAYKFQTKVNFKELTLDQLQRIEKIINETGEKQ